MIRVATEAGADVVALCDTNGGMLPGELGDVVTAVAAATGARLGIHCHDDTACAVANSLVAVDAGVTHVQGCANGYGERAGNANLFSVVAGLQLKKGQVVLPDGCLPEMSRVAHAISEVTNVTPSTHQPYVGYSAFAHKAGLHASAVKVDPMLYQHIDPELVGNDMRMLVSDMAGRASVEIKGKQLGYDLSGDKGTVGRVVHRVKELEARGYTFEAADASFELLLRDELAGERQRHFQVESWRVIVEQRSGGEVVSEATVKLHAKGERIVATGEGNGPVNSLDKALRLGLERLYPELAMVELSDYKVRILEGSHGTGAVTRVLIESSDGTGTAGGPGARWAWTRTSSPPPGTPWRKPSPLPCSGQAASQPGIASLAPVTRRREVITAGMKAPRSRTFALCYWNRAFRYGSDISLRTYGRAPDPGSSPASGCQAAASAARISPVRDASPGELRCARAAVLGLLRDPRAGRGHLGRPDPRRQDTAALKRRAARPVLAGGPGRAGRGDAAGRPAG